MLRKYMRLAYKKCTFKIIFGIILSLLLLALGTDAVPVEEWNKSFGGTKSDAANSIWETSDGGYILAGYTYSYGDDRGNAWLVKTDANGSEQWNKTFSGNYSGEANSVQQTSDGSYVLTGKAYSKAWLIKTDTNGNLHWSKVFEDAAEANSVWQTSDGGYIITGKSHSNGNVDAWLMKTDINGNKQWSKKFGGPGEDSARSVQQTSDNEHIIVVGSTYGPDWYSIENITIFGITVITRPLFGPNGKDAWLIKLVENGNEQWNKTYGGSGSDEVNSVQQTSDGGYIMAGWTDSYGAGGRDAWLLKTDDYGNQQWNKTFGGTGFDLANSVQQTSDGGYVIGGLKGSYEDRGAWIIKTDASGNQQWSKTFGDTDNAEASSVQQTSDGSYIMAGYTPLNGPNGRNAWLIKVVDDKSPIQTLTANPAKTSEVNSTKSGVGFETLPAIGIIIVLAFYLAGKKKR